MSAYSEALCASIVPRIPHLEAGQVWRDIMGHPTVTVVRLEWDESFRWWPQVLIQAPGGRLDRIGAAAFIDAVQLPVALAS